MRPGLAQALDALALKAEKNGAAQEVPPRLLRDVANALRDLEYVGQHGDAWSQRVARDGRPGAAAKPGDA